MSKFFLYGFILSVSLAGAACQTTSAPGSNVESKNTAVNPKNVPPEFAVNAVSPSGNSTPGIPAEPGKPLPKGATPTPGIPAEPGKPLPKGATPTPGIPDLETRRRQMNQNVDINVVNNPPPASSNSSGGDARPRKATKRTVGENNVNN